MGNSDKEEKLLKLVKDVAEKLNMDEPFFVCDLGDVIKKHNHWKTMLPRVELFYAVKTNDELPFLNFLSSLGIGFDCSNKIEIEKVFSVGASSSQIIFDHTFKMPSHLKYAKKHGIDLLSFDAEEELLKISEYFPKARLILRFQVPNVKTIFQLHKKFGCEMSECRHLLTVARRLNLSVVGTSFHVGGLCKDPTAYSRAIEMAKEVCDLAKDFDYKLSILDIGGGFPGHAECYEEFDQICHCINDALEKFFPKTEDVRIIAEPGTYFAGSAFTLCTRIIGKKSSKTNEKSDEKTEKVYYYLNDGTLGSVTIKYEEYGTKIKPLLTTSELKERTIVLSKLWGFTVAPFDCVKEKHFFPEMNVGEHIAFTNMGAYSISVSTIFNGFEKPFVQYVFPDSYGDLGWNLISENEIPYLVEKAKSLENGIPK